MWREGLLVVVLMGSSPSPGAEPPARLDLNRATRAELASLPGVGPATAERIVRVRERNGPFRCVEEVRALPRLTDRQAAALVAHTFVAGFRARQDCAASGGAAPPETRRPARASTP